MTDIEKSLNYYRSAAENKRPDYIPARVNLMDKVRSDFPMFSEEGRGYYAEAGEHDCESNQYGAISVRAKNGKMLGVKPCEFEVVAWRLNVSSSPTAAGDAGGAQLK